MDHETWLLDAGGDVIAKQARGERLSSVERLVYCLWVADYGMRNAGDLETARDLHPSFQRDAVRLAEALGLRVTQAAFALPPEALEAAYLDRFDAVCAEVRDA